MATPHLATLPDVVLHEIFLWAIAFAEGLLSIQDAPLNLSQTCRSLRAFALSQSRFWTRINLACRNNFRLPTYKISQSWISLWVERSGNALLDIAVNFYREDPYLIRENDKRVVALSILATAHSRWRRFALCFGTSDRFVRSYGLTVANLLQLRELVVDDFILDTENGNKAVIFVNGTLELSTIAQTQTPIAPCLVHLHIKNTKSSSSSRDGLEAMLDHCPALECINVGYIGDYIWPLDEGKGIVGASGTHNRLSRICMCHNIDLLSVLNDSRAPALEHLEVYIYYKESRPLARSLVSSHIGPLVRKAVLDLHPDGGLAPPNPEEARDELYRALSNVTHLFLALPDLYKVHDLVSLSFDAGGRRLFPELEHFKLILPAQLAARPRPLERMLVSRLLHSDRIRVVVDICKWDAQKSKKFIEREGIKPWMDTGRLEVIL